MSKHKVKRYDGEDESMVESDAMEEANKGENLDTEAGFKSMPRRPISRTPVAKVAPRKTSTDDRSKRPSLRGTTDTEPRDRFGIPTSMGNAGKNYAPTGKAAESASGSELMRNIEAAGNTFGASGAMQAVRRGDAVAKGLREFAAGRAGAKETAKRVEPTMRAAKSAPSVNVRSSAADPKIMEKVSAALKNAPRPVSKPTASQAAFAKGPKGSLGRQSAKEREAILRADTMDEFGAAMKRGGSVKRYASGGSISSRADGIAQRGKTRGMMR